MANYLAMNRDELTAEKAALEAKYKEFQAKGLKLNMARGKPGPHQMDLAMDLLKMNDYTTDAGTDARNYGELEGLQEARVLFADVFGVQPGEVFVGGNSSLQLMYNLINMAMCLVSRSLRAPGLRWRSASSSARCPAMTVTLPSPRSLALSSSVCR